MEKGRRENRGTEVTVGSRADPGANLALLLTSCVTLDESLSLPEPASCYATRPTFPISRARRED